MTAALLAGCASTTSNYASKGVLLEDGSYYFPAQDGRGDYYYEEPARNAGGAFWLGMGNGFGYGFGHGFMGFSSQYCGLRSLYCSPWPYWYGADHRVWFGEPQPWRWRHDRRERGSHDRGHESDGDDRMQAGQGPRRSRGRDRGQDDMRNVPPHSGPDRAELPGVEEPGDENFAPMPLRRQRSMAPPTHSSGRDSAGSASDRQQPQREPDREPARVRIRESGHDEDGQ